jgi:hypothetical protein
LEKHFNHGIQETAINAAAQSRQALVCIQKRIVICAEEMRDHIEHILKEVVPTMPVSKTKKKLIAAILFFALSVASCSLAAQEIKYSEVRDKIIKGQSKQEITALLGQPSQKKVTAKSNKYIWGPEEDFWDKIPMGTRLEVWTYQFSDGLLNLYFMNEGKRLDYKAFAPKGVVY